MKRLSLCLAATLLSVASAASTMQKPNILLVLVDDMGYSDLSCFGSEIHTPNIDKLGAEGIKFTNFTNNAKCETSRTALMSGRFHVEDGVYQGRGVITIPETLALAGYQNFALGKWHIFDTPMKRGFDRYFGFHEGATNFFNGEGTGGGFSYHLDEVALEPSDLPEDFYSTYAFTDYGIQFIEERDKAKPFFMYMAYNAPHYPLQAPEAEVLKYKGKYLDGWQKVRDDRFARLKELGIIDADAELSNAEKSIGGWDQLSEAQKIDMDLRMATYAAMVDIVDQEVGRLVETLKQEGIYEDTLIIFLSDNGACPFDRTRKPTKENNYMPWDERSYWCYPVNWAKACNTPFQGNKQSQFEGGIATPMIAHWPNGITVPGTFNRQRSHLVDFHATFRELAGIEYPSQYDPKTKELSGPSVGPARGISLAPAFTGAPRSEHAYLYQNFSNGKTALIRGDWKLVNFQKLYNLKQDRIESQELRRSSPDKFEFMRDEFARIDVELNQGRALERTELGKQALITDWLVYGPLDDLEQQGEAAFASAFAPTAQWQPLTAPAKNGQFNLMKQLGKALPKSAFVKTTLIVPHATEAVLEASGNERVYAMLNGAVVNTKGGTVHLNQGANTLMLKVVRKKSKYWSFSCKLKKDFLAVPGLEVIAK